MTGEGSFELGKSKSWRARLGSTDSTTWFQLEKEPVELHKNETADFHVSFLVFKSDIRNS